MAPALRTKVPFIRDMGTSTCPGADCNSEVTNGGPSVTLTAIGGTHMCLREVRGDAICQQIREHGVTYLNAAPTVVGAI
jgi:hypothetical protein